MLIGHHERRRHFGETQEIVSKKVKEAEDCQLGIVYCCGEEASDRKADMHEQVLTDQLAALKDANIEDWSKIIIAYEPLWAMNTGAIASMDQTQDCAAFIRNWVRENIGAAQAEVTRVVYAGNVTEINAQ